MTFTSDNVIPGDHGKTFGTNAKDNHELEIIKNFLLRLEGVSNVVLNNTVYPREITVYSSKVLGIVAVEEQVKMSGFHAIPKEIF